jgi:phosphoribosyl 1,2-cyclic phosphodiesterase
MQLTVINSNSKGNAYILESSSGEALLLECGVHFQETKKALGFNMKRVVGCLITHDHQDHCAAVKDVLDSGIRVYASYGTHEAMKTQGHHRAAFVHPMADHFMVGSFKVKAYDVKHDAAQPLCFLVHHPECGVVLFLTDTYYCEYRFKGLNQVIIEANYCQSIVDRRVEEGTNPKFLRDRVLQSHMSLQTCKKTLQAYDLSQVMNIVLIHLSDGNSDENRFRSEVQASTGKQVHVARAGMKIDFNLKPF